MPDGHDPAHLGLVALLGPMPVVAEALRDLEPDGVPVKALTGASERVAGHVRTQAGLPALARGLRPGRRGRTSPDGPGADRGGSRSC